MHLSPVSRLLPTRRWLMFGMTICPSSPSMTSVTFPLRSISIPVCLPSSRDIFVRNKRISSVMSFDAGIFRRYIRSRLFSVAARRPRVLPCIDRAIRSLPKAVTQSSRPGTGKRPDWLPGATFPLWISIYSVRNPTACRYPFPYVYLFRFYHRRLYVSLF